MENVSVKFANPGHAVFFIADSEGTQLAKLIVDIIESDLIVYGTEALKGNRRLASQLFTAIISYAREHYLKVIAFNSFVYNRLKNDPEQFADVWDENSASKE
jgi:predicted GNAT family acetyltransferase